MSGLDHVDTLRWPVTHRGGEYGVAEVRAGQMQTKHSRYVTHRRRPVIVQVTASPTGRSVQVHVNGQKVYP